MYLDADRKLNGSPGADSKNYHDACRLNYSVWLSTSGPHKTVCKQFMIIVSGLICCNHDKATNKCLGSYQC